MHHNEVLTQTKNKLLKNQNSDEEIELDEQNINNNQYLMFEQEISNYQSKIYEKNKELNNIKNEYKLLQMKYDSQEKFIDSNINKNYSKKHFEKFRLIKKRIMK